MAMASKEIPNFDRGEYIPNINKSENKQPKANNCYMNFTQIPKGIKEKLNLPLKSSTYLKNMISTKSQQGNKFNTNKNISKNNYESNISPLNSTNPNNFKRSFSINDTKKPINERENDINNNSNNYNSNNFSYSGINYYTGNFMNHNVNNNTNSNSNNLLRNSNKNISSNKNTNNKNSRSKSNGRSKNTFNNNTPMMNLLKTYTNKSKHENPATYRKYRAQTKSTDKLYQNITRYPVHINPNDSTEYNNNSNNNFYNSKNSENRNNNNNANSTDNPYPTNDVNVNLSKYNDYEYYHNLSLQKDNANKNGFSNINNYSTKNEGSNSKMKKSFNILSDILDSHFTINSPSQPKFSIAENDFRNGHFKTNIGNNVSDNINNNLNSQTQNFNSTKNNINNENFVNSNNNNNLNPNSQNPNINLSINQKNENTSPHELYKDKIYQQNEDPQNTKLTINLSYLGENPPDRYLEALEHIMTILDPIFERLSFIQKLEKFIENTEDHRRSIRLGSLVGIYILLKKYQIDDAYKITILEKIISLLHNYETQEELFLVACLEIAGLFAPCDLLCENISLISMFLTDFNFPKLQKAAFNCLMLMEYDGIKALVDLASKDIKDYTKFILNCLIGTPHIQKSVIIRALINEIYSNHPDKRHAALAALNRMHDLVGEVDILNKLSYFFKDPKIEKIFLASTLRTAGEKGEKILLEELKINNDFSVRVAVASVFAYRTTKNPNYLEIRLDKNDTFSIAKTLPGNFCTYYGKISPYVYEKILSEHEQLNYINNLNNNLNMNQSTNLNLAEESNLAYEEYLQVNTRDFLAALQRLVSINYNHQNPKIVHKGNYNILDDLDVEATKSEVSVKYTNFFKIEKPEHEINNNLNNSHPEFSQSKRSLNNINKNNNFNNNNNFISDAVEISKNLISEDVIKSLCVCLKDYSSAVRETAANSLAHIGLPEALGAVGALIESLKDADVLVRSKVIAAIGKIASGCDNFVIPYLIEALKTNFWKVKLASLNTLAEFGFRASKLALPYLQKLLRESAINKQNIADTIVKLGYEGESILLKILTTEDDSNYKLKSVIAKALSYCAINGPNIDFIIETLFKTSNSDVALIRLNSLVAIKNLADKSDENITYLKKKNVIPFYYNKLTDKDLAIQSYAIEAIKQLGPQGELIFIEGLSKDSNPIIRANCAIGLANIGPHTIRTLLIGLHDENKEVRKIVEKEITGKFAVYDILDLFMEKNSQKLSLKIAIRDILEKCDTLQPATRNYFNDIIINLDREIYNTNNYINLDEMKKYKKEVDQYLDTYGDEIQEDNNNNENNFAYEENENEGKNINSNFNNANINNVNNNSNYKNLNNNYNSSERNYRRKQ